MRYLAIILMLVLLPLRGWVGEAMAMDMLAQHAVAIQKVAAHANHTSADAAFDDESPVECHEAADSADPSASACGTCQLCQMCHSVAAPMSLTAIPTPWLVHAQPTTGHTRFVSAPAAFALKPPIS